MSKEKILIISERVEFIERCFSLSLSVTDVKNVHKTMLAEQIPSTALLQEYDVIVLDILFLSKDKNYEAFRDQVVLHGFFYKTIVVFNNDSQLDLVSKFDPSEYLLKVESSKLKLTTFLMTLKKILDQKELDSREKINEEFIPLRLYKVKKIQISPCDLYLKISTDKFLKLINERENISQEQVERYLSRGVEFIYVLKEDFDLSADLLLGIQLPDILNYKTTIDYASNSFELMNDFLNDLGVSSEIVETANKISENIIENLPDGELADIFTKFKNSPDRFIHDHSFLTSTISVSLAKKLGWDNRENLKKLVMASMFHDIGFKNVKVALLENLSLLSVEEQEKSIRDEIFNHPQVAYDLLFKVDSISQDVLNLVLRHHEGVGEKSYPKKLSGSTLTSFECLFVLAHDFVLELYKHCFNLEKKNDIYQLLIHKYNSGNFKPILLKLRQLIDSSD